MLAVPQQPPPQLPPAPIEATRPWVHPAKRWRRTATAVLAGVFDERQPASGRDALTTLLNGVGPVNWQAAVRVEHERRGIVLPKGQFSLHGGDIAGVGGGKHKKEVNGRRRLVAGKHRSSQGLNLSSLMTDEDGLLHDDDDDAYPSLLTASTLPPTPERSVSSSTPSMTSSRRLVTPFDLDPMSPHAATSPSVPHASRAHGTTSNGVGHHKGGGKFATTHISHVNGRGRARSSPSDFDEPLSKRVKLERSDSMFSAANASEGDGNGFRFAGDSGLNGVMRRRKRAASKKGWKGWIEVDESEPERDTSRLIKLDATPPIKERRTRSGKNFDAIGVGDMSWV